MASRLQIAKKGLQKIGAATITAFDENSNNAEKVREVYDVLRRSELSANYWTFAIARVKLPADSTVPAFGRSYRFAKPGDYLRKAPDDPSYQSSFSDILVEGQYLLTDCAGPLELRYVQDIQDAEKFDPLFADALSMRIAMELAEPLTQSTSKGQAAETSYKYFIDLAKKINGIESGPIAREVDEMVAVRYSYDDPSLRKIQS